VITQPVAFRPLIDAAHLVVSHGSFNLSCEALMAGKPQLFFPFDPEKALVARCLGKLGVSLALRPGRTVSDAKRVMSRLLTEPGFDQAAQAIAALQRPAEWRESLDRLVNAALGLTSAHLDVSSGTRH
jgi:UDP:flavonoid glycosyltransferase YjiC (YdhE family)